jgi:hypothetical protein
MARVGELSSNADVATTEDLEGIVGSGGATTIADGADVALGAKADAAASDDTGTFSLLAFIKRGLTKIPALVNGRLPVEVGNFLATQPVSQATQPLPTGAATETTLAAVKTGTDKIPTTPASEHTTAGSPHSARLSDGAVFIDPRDVSDRAARQLGVTMSKRDTGRTSITLTAEAVAGATSEALINFTRSVGCAATTTGTSYSVTAGKLLRITKIVFSWVATTTTANTARVRLRVNTGGAAALTSPLQMSFRLAWESPTFIANEGKTVVIEVPEGFDIPSGAGVGMTHQEAAANGTLDVTIWAYEWTP